MHRAVAVSTAVLDRVTKTMSIAPLLTGGGGGGKREIIYLSLRCHHQNDSCIKIGSDESHLNVSVGGDGQRHKTLTTNHNLF